VKKIKHIKYGIGIVDDNLQHNCRGNEVFVKFIDNLPILKSTAIAGYQGGHYTEETMYENSDIVDIKDIVYLDEEQI